MNTTARKTHGFAHRPITTPDDQLEPQERVAQYHKTTKTDPSEPSKSFHKHHRRTREPVPDTPSGKPIAKQQSSNPRPPATQADRTALLTCIQKYPHHPDTEAGRRAHQAQQAEWAKTHGLGTYVTESTPQPLRPGTLPVSSGECFTCGFTGHMGGRDGSTCGGNRALHRHEQTWRAICSRILRQTRSAANIQLVMVDDYETTWQEIQGNEYGPSN